MNCDRVMNYMLEKLEELKVNEPPQSDDVKELYNTIRWRHKDFVLSIWSNILKLISQTVYQFSAPQFRDYLKQPWYGAGYYDQKPTEFKMPVQYCLQFKLPAHCACGDYAFLRCAVCENMLCFKHAIVEMHCNCDV